MSSASAAHPGADPRATILDRIRRATGISAPAAWEAIAAQAAALPRDYQRTGLLSSTDRLLLLEDRLRDYDAEVTRVTSAQVADAISAALGTLDPGPALIPPGFPAEWLPPGADLTEDHNLTPRQLDHFPQVLTTATLAIAETGTLVLQNVPGQGRRAATLIPDIHLCVVREQDIVETVPEAFIHLAATSTLPTTFVSGPSATADIEMTRIKGVHGPRFLHVFIVLSEPEPEQNEPEQGREAIPS